MSQSPKYVILIGNSLKAQVDSALEANELSAELAVREEQNVVVYRLVYVRNSDKSKPLNQPLKRGWYEVWSYKGTEKNSMAEYLAVDEDGSRIFFGLEGGIKSVPRPFGNQTLRVESCACPFSPKEPS